MTETWDALWRTGATGVVTYAGLVVILRVSGTRTLSKLNAFDLVVTVALGSTLASTLVSRQVPVARGLVALATLVALQLLVTWSSVRLPVVRRVVRAGPVALVVDGAHRADAMTAERVTESEVAQAVRRQGRGSISDLAAVVLETDGSLSVIGRDGDLSALDDVRGWSGGRGTSADGHR